MSHVGFFGVELGQLVDLTLVTVLQPVGGVEHGTERFFRGTHHCCPSSQRVCFAQYGVTTPFANGGSRGKRASGELGLVITGGRSDNHSAALREGD